MPPKPKPDPEPLLPKPLVVRGHLVTLDESQPELDKGAIYVDRDGIIQAVQESRKKAPAGFEDVNTVETDGLVFPGLIDLHNHVAYNCLPLWSSPTRTEPWEHREQWPNDDDYKPSISLPTNALCEADGKAVLKYVETKAVVGGVTAIQGSAKVKRPFEGWMVRNIEYETFRTKKKTVNQSVRPISSAEGWKDTREKLAKGNSFLYHLCEGVVPDILDDFEGMRDHGCLSGRFIGIHSTALDDPQFKEWRKGTKDAALVWSPFSNLWLYGGTTDVVGARAKGVRICLGSDWSPSGSKHLLGELKVADLYNSERLDDAFDPEEIVRMATSNPAEALGWEKRLGRLKKGLHADFVIVRRRPGDVYRALIESTERDVELVAINGYPMYGLKEMMRAGAAVNPEAIRVARGLNRTITLRDERIEDADMDWDSVIESLERIRQDPEAGRRAAEERDAKPLKLKADKHFDDPEEHPELLDLAASGIPARDGLVHDAAYFDDVDRMGFHEGLLSGLRDYYPDVRRGRFERQGRVPAAAGRPSAP